MLGGGLLQNARLGDCVSFRYRSLVKSKRDQRISQGISWNAQGIPSQANSFSRGVERPRGPVIPRAVMVLTTNYNGEMHAVKIAALTYEEQHFISQGLRAGYQDPAQAFQYAESQIQQRKQELDVLKRQREELLRKGRQVIVSPVLPQQQNIPRDKRILGSVVGSVSTFGRTNVQPQPPNQKREVDRLMQINQNQTLFDKKQRELDFMLNDLQRKRQEFSGQPIPTNAYDFYHTFFKVYVGGTQRVKTMYRRYNLQFVQTPRIISFVTPIGR
jgi:hypothetical protein